jgi:hypothetical protein
MQQVLYTTYGGNYCLEPIQSQTVQRVILREHDGKRFFPQSKCLAYLGLAPLNTVVYRIWGAEERYAYS